MRPRSPILQLQIERLSQLQVERASKSCPPEPFGLVSSVAMGLLDQKSFRSDVEEAKIWVQEAIRMVRSAPGGHLLGSDGQIAQQILDGIAKKRQKRPKEGSSGPFSPGKG